MPQQETGISKRDGPPIERRRSRRQHVLKRGRIVSGFGNLVMNCYILDISDGGAKLMPEHISLCPKQFVLESDPELGLPRNCEVVWQSDEILGIRFIDMRHEAEGGAAPSLMRRGQKRL